MTGRARAEVGAGHVRGRPHAEHPRPAAAGDVPMSGDVRFNVGLDLGLPGTPTALAGLVRRRAIGLLHGIHRQVRGAASGVTRRGDHSPDEVARWHAALSPQPSPDGRWLVYGSKRNGVRQLYLMRLTDRS